MKHNQKGITIVGLIITVVVITIIAGVCIYTGRDLLEEAKLEQLKTNMLLIQAKCQSIAEKVDAKELTPNDYIGESIGIEEGEVTTTIDTPIVGTITSKEGDIWYGLTQKDIEEKEYTVEEITKQGIGLGDIVKAENENEAIYYINYKDCEVVYKAGYNGKYTLTDIKDL